MMGTFFDVSDLQYAGTAADGLARWWVTLRDVSYRGKVIAPADQPAEWIVERLDRMASRDGLAVTQGRLYSPVTITD